MFASHINSTQVPALLAKKAEMEAALKKLQEELNADRPQFIAQVREWIVMFDIKKEEAYPPAGKETKEQVDKDFSTEYFYRDTKTGEEWNGKGKRPAFLHGKKKLEPFRIYHATGTNEAPTQTTTASPAEPDSAVSQAEVNPVVATNAVSQMAQSESNIAAPQETVNINSASQPVSNVDTTHVNAS